MIKHTFKDGSIGYEYEVDDLVEFTRASNTMWSDPRKGDWGKVSMVYIDKKHPNHWATRTMRVQLAGYCYKKDSFLQCVPTVFPWEVKPREKI